jgi:Trk K+ transport system NAD-binding subunit
MDPGDLTRFFPQSTTGGGAQRRRIVLYVVGLIVTFVVYAAAYMVLMATFEGVYVDFPKALLAVIESFTTTGYGEDAALWTTWQLQTFAVLMQLTGVALIFLALPVFLAPWFEERLSTTAPTAIEDLSGHVVVAGFTSRGEELIRELALRDIPYVVVEPDRDAAADIHETGTTVIHGDPESGETLRNACLPEARALVADVNDEANAAISLTADDVCEDAVPVITFVEEADVAEYHRLAGADQVFTPRRLIGTSLATKVTAGLSRGLGDAIEIGDDFDIVEFPVQAGAELAGTTIAESGIRERTGANIVGAWFRGEFVSPPSPDAYIDEQTILLVAGHERQLERLKGLTLAEERRRRPGRVIIAGYGMVGTTIEETIRGTEYPVTTVDWRDLDGVDVVGDVTDEETLERAGLSEANTVILALGDDTLTIFATLVIRDLEPEIEIIARADATESVRKVYKAGADYVLSLATVSGRMLASTILQEEVISFDRQVEVVRLPAGRLAGRSLRDADVRARTGCTVVAVERGGEVIVDLGPEFEVRRGDDLVVTGTDADIAQFSNLFESGV